jgi:hypothetical protein
MPATSRPTTRDLVAVILAAGLATAVNLLVFALVWQTISDPSTVLSDESTQLLTIAFGGLIGLLGAVVGFRHGARVWREDREPE